ncbi:MAG: glycerol kinase GlpK [Sphingomicrobium sp.]
MTDERLLLVFDAGTSSTRALLFASDGTLVAAAQEEIAQHYPRPGWVEHDASEIWERTLACGRQMVERAGGADRIAAIGISNQRETAVAWDRTTGAPLTRAIVWQDRRTSAACAALKAAGHEPAVTAATGLLIDPYFSATKWRWMIDEVPEVAAAAQRDTLALGTVESWLVWKLSGGTHVSDASNASRTLLMALTGAGFDEGLCDLFGVPIAALPHVVDNAGALAMCDAGWFGGAIPICGLAGDQQAATIGQGCLAPGATKATFGSGAFILTSTGTAVPASKHRLLATVLCQVGGERLYALEGSVFVAGSMVKWLRDAMGWIEHAADTERIARATGNGGVVVVPALAGLGAPHWRPEAKAAIVGLTLGTASNQVVRAAMESIAHQCSDLHGAFAADGADWRSVRIDGGMAANGWLAQDLADLLQVPVERPADVECTARGAAMLAAVGAGFYATLDEAKAMLPAVERFDPVMGADERAARLDAWHEALAMLLSRPA